MKKTWTILAVCLAGIPMPAHAELLLEVLLNPPQVRLQLEDGAGHEIDGIPAAEPGSAWNVVACTRMGMTRTGDSRNSPRPINVAFMNGTLSGSGMFKNSSPFSNPAFPFKSLKGKEKTTEDEAPDNTDAEESRSESQSPETADTKGQVAGDPPENRNM